MGQPLAQGGFSFCKGKPECTNRLIRFTGKFAQITVVEFLRWL